MTPDWVFVALTAAGAAIGTGGVYLAAWGIRVWISYRRLNRDAGQALDRLLRDLDTFEKGDTQ